MTDKDIVEDAMQAAIEAAVDAVASRQIEHSKHYAVDAILRSGPSARDLATAAITAYIEARRAAGFVEVPEVPTEAMLKAARNAPLPMVRLDSMTAQANLSLRANWSAMIAARPDA